jgi:glycosyltransferase involved in cell wall biosynthesis
MTLSVSVAMATYNGAKYLTEQLDSIAAQSALPAELVISDDGSTDETLSIASQFAERSPFPVHVHRNQRTLRYARNFREAARRCRGDLIAFSDQDDWWSPDRLEKCVARFDDPETLLLYHNAWLVDGERRRTGKLYDRETEQRALDLKPLGPWNHSYGLVQIFRSDLRQFDDLWDDSLSHITEPQDILTHDQWYFFLAEALGRVEFLDEPLLEYRQHGSNQVSAEEMRPAVTTRLLARLEHYGDQDLRAAKAAESRSRIMRKIAGRVTAKRERLLEIAGRYDILAERNHRRFRTYSDRGPARRLGNLVSSWSKGDYSDWPWGFDKRSIVRDLWSGVLLSRREPAS